MTTRRLPLALILLAPLAVAQQNSTPYPATSLPPNTPTDPSPSSTPYSPGSDWSLSAEQVDLVHRRIQSAESELDNRTMGSAEEEIVNRTISAEEESMVTTTLPPVDYEEQPEEPEEPEEPSSVTGEHLPSGRRAPDSPVGRGWTASRQVLDAGYPARRRRQVSVQRRRQIPNPLAPTQRPSQPRKPGSGGKGQGEYHGTVLGAVFIKPKPKKTIVPSPVFINRL